MGHLTDPIGGYVLVLRVKPYMYKLKYNLFFNYKRLSKINIIYLIYLILNNYRKTIDNLI